MALLSVPDNNFVVDENFSKANDEYMKTIEDYLLGGYKKSLAKLLAYIGNEKASEILAKYPENLRNEILQLYENLEDKSPENADIMSEACHALKKSENASSRITEKTLENLNEIYSSVLHEKIQAYQNLNPIMFYEIEKNLYIFEDILFLDDRAIQKILREVDSQTLALALKNEPQEICDKIFRNMSLRAAEIIKEDMEFMGPALESHITSARNEIMLVVKKLDKNGEIIFIK